MLARATSHPTISPAAVTRPERRQTLSVHRERDEGRTEVERFIHGVYRERYGARVQHYAPILVSLRNELGEMIAAAGYRVADTAPLFLERYLPQPVESLLAIDAPQG